MRDKKKIQQQQDDVVIQWLTFSLHNEIYGIEVLKVREALRLMEISIVPGAPDHVIGIINLRGQVITVNNVRMRLGLPDTEVTDNSRIILIETTEQTQGILADSVSEIVNINSSDVDYSTSQVNDNNQYLIGTYKHGETLVILLSAEDIIFDGEDDDF